MTDEEGRHLGKSRAAARIAVNQTANSRFFLAIPIFIPPIILYTIEKRGIMPRNFYARTALELCAIAFELYCAVPLAIGAYPQNGTITAENIEEEFRQMRDAQGQPIRVFHFNKGL